MSETFSVKADVVSGENKGYGCSAPVGGVIHCAGGMEVDLDMLRSNGIYPVVFGRQEKREMPHKAKTVVRSSTGIGGKINLFECFKACQEIGVSSIVIEQDVCPRDPFDCLQNSYKNLMEIAKQAGDR